MKNTSDIFFGGGNKFYDCVLDLGKSKAPFEATSVLLFKYNKVKMFRVA